MKRLFLALAMALFSLSLLPEVAEAKRLGGGGSAGMQRSLPARTAPDAAPAKPVAPANAAAPATPMRLGRRGRSLTSQVLPRTFRSLRARM